MLVIHKEGRLAIVVSFLILFPIFWLIISYMEHLPIWQYTLASLVALLFLFILSFFRNPQRNITVNDNVVLSPADGKIVVLEEVEETEFFKDKRLQVSIFMSPTNVHLNRIPISGKVKYVKYHPGKYLVAWHPKSSTANERNSVVFENQKITILVRQIAGAVARRIKFYLHENEDVIQGHELGFIKFGSRVDIFFPLDVNIKVELNQQVRGGKTIIAAIV